MEQTPPPPPAVTPLRRGLLAGTGLLCVGLGVAGIVIPGLPTTPFLLAASYLFARSSPGLSTWLTGHRWLGPYLRAVGDERGLPRRARVATIALLWATLGLSAWLLHRNDQLESLAAGSLLAVGLSVSWFVGVRLGPRARDA